MRTTIRLDDQLLRLAKKRAAETGSTLTALIEDALRQQLQSAPASARRRTPRLPTFKGTGLRSGVDLDDSAALLDVMEER